MEEQVVVSNADLESMMTSDAFFWLNLFIYYFVYYINMINRTYGAYY